MPSAYSVSRPINGGESIFPRKIKQLRLVGLVGLHLDISVSASPITGSSSVSAFKFTMEVVLFSRISGACLCKSEKSE